MKFVRLASLMACAVLAVGLSGCGILGSNCDGAEGFLKIQSPVAVGVQQHPTELPPSRQMAVVAAPVAVQAAPVGVSYGAGACAAPVPYNPSPEPNFGYAPRAPRYVPEK